MELQVGVKVLLKNKEEKYLILFRSEEKYKGMKKLWDIPGGRINIGSSLMDNLRREVREETGLEIEGTPELLAAQDIIKIDKHVVRLTYKGEASGEVKLSEEHTGFEWLSIEEILKIPNLDNFLKDVLGVNF